MNEQKAQTIQADEYWTLEEIIADAEKDDAFWESPEFDLFAVDAVRFYTQKRALLKLVDSLMKKIVDLNTELQKEKALKTAVKDKLNT